MSSGPRKRDRQADGSTRVAPAADRLLSERSLERHAAAVQSFNDAIKKNPHFTAVNVDWGLGPYYPRFLRWLLATKRVKSERDVKDEKSWRLMDDFYDFAVEFNSLKLDIEYYSSTAAFPSSSSPAVDKGAQKKSDEEEFASDTIAENVWRATHTQNWADFSVAQERRR